MGKKTIGILATANLLVVSACIPSSTLTPPPYTHNSGFVYCSKSTQIADDYSNSYTRWAFVASALGAAGVATGAVMGPDPDPDWPHDPSLHWINENRNILTTGVGSALLLLGLHLFSRSDAASDFGAATGEAMKHKAAEDREAYNDCVTARSVWISSQKTSNQIISNEVAKMRKRVDEVEKEVADTKKRTSNASANADKIAPTLDAGVPADGG